MMNVAPIIIVEEITVGIWKISIKSQSKNIFSTETKIPIQE